MVLRAGLKAQRFGLIVSGAIGAKALREGVPLGGSQAGQSFRDCIHRGATSEASFTWTAR